MYPMNRDELAHGFSNLLGLSVESVFEESKTATGDLELSGWALEELAKVITLPDGYDLTTTIRTPAINEFFLDLEALVEEERVVVYKATGTVTNANLILHPVSVNATASTALETVEQFDFFLCMLQGGIAKHMDKIVRLLLPAVDKGGKVVVVHNGKFKLVALASLRHVDNPEAMNSLDNLSLSDIHNKLKDIGWSNKTSNKTSKDPYKDRWGISFD